MRYGHFDTAAHEYVIERPDTPVSWTNYLGVKDMCTVISHNAGGYSFYKSAEHGRMTRFRPNGVPLDRPGHYVYVRDDDTGEYLDHLLAACGARSRAGKLRGASRAFVYQI